MVKILFIDDEEMITEISAITLERAGYEVESFYDAILAFNSFKGHLEQFDLIMIDQMMPDILGIELAIKFKDINHDIPIIIMTGEHDEKLINKVNDLNFFYLRKPYGQKEILKIVEDCTILLP